MAANAQRIAPHGLESEPEREASSPASVRELQVHGGLSRLLLRGPSAPRRAATLFAIVSSGGAAIRGALLDPRAHQCDGSTRVTQVSAAHSPRMWWSERLARTKCSSSQR